MVIECRLMVEDVISLVSAQGQSLTNVGNSEKPVSDQVPPENKTMFLANTRRYVQPIIERTCPC